MLFLFNNETLMWQIIQTSKIKVHSLCNASCVMNEMYVFWMRIVLSVMVKQAYFETYMKCFVGLSEFWRWDQLFGQDLCW